MTLETWAGRSAPADPSAPEIDSAPGAVGRSKFQIAHIVNARALETSSMAEKCEVSERTIQRWIENGIPTWWDADTFACKVLDEHPAALFGDEFMLEDDGQDALFEMF